MRSRIKSSKKVRMDKWCVAILTPTRNRATMLVQCAKFVAAQSCCPKQLKWYVLDDSDEPLPQHIIQEIHRVCPDTRRRSVHIRRVDGPLRIGAKRNLLGSWACGEGAHICVAMDDDDFYGPKYVQRVMETMHTTSHQLVGSSNVVLYMSQFDCMAYTESAGENHSCNGLLTFRREYWDAGNRYDETVEFAEETSFTKSFSEPLAVLPAPSEYNVVLSHAGNTFDKTPLLDQPNQLLKSMKDKTLDDFVPPDVAAHFRSFAVTRTQPDQGLENDGPDRAETGPM